VLSLGAPLLLAAAAGVAAVVVALHFLAWRRPRPVELPTARFVPPSAVRAVSRDLRLTDAAVLASRVLAILLAGLALADPQVPPPRAGSPRVILADRSRAVGDAGEVGDSVRALASEQGVQRVIWFDSAPAPASDATADSAAPRAESRGSLSAALVAAVREGNRLARTAERVELVIVSPFAREEWDAAVAPAHALWDGASRAVRVAARLAPPPPAGGALLPAADPVGAAVRSALGERAGVRAVRGAPSADDSAFARRGGVVLTWPAEGGAEVAARASAVTTGDHTAIGAFVVRDLAPEGRAVAWREDGTVAARELATGSGCVRTIGFAPPVAGDLALRPAVADVVRDLAGACGAADWAPVPDAAVATLTRPASLASPAAPATESAPRGEWTRWLLLAALLALAAEWWLRRERARGAATDDAATGPRSRREAA